MIFKQTFDPTSSTYTYLLSDEKTREAILIDPVKDPVPEHVALLKEMNLKLVYALGNHAHADNVTSSCELRRLLGARTVVSRRAGSKCTDVQVSDGAVIRFGRHAIEERETPRHTQGCLSYVARVGECTMAFTGGSLFVHGYGITDFPGKNAGQLNRSINEKIYTLPDDTVIYPCRDYRGNTQATVDKEKATSHHFNTNISENQFVNIMAEQNLPNARLIDITGLANLACEQLQTEAAQ
jgi:sulfur dioxygenase